MLDVPTPEIAMVDVTEMAIRAAVSPGAFAAGQAYFRHGRVHLTDVDEAAGVIYAMVQGSQDEPYDQSISIWRAGGKICVEGDCSCPVGYNCKHVAAALIAQLHAKPAATRGAPAGTVTASPEAMPAALAIWLSDLRQGVKTESEAYPANVSRRLFYMLGRDQSYGEAAGTVRLTLAVSDVKKNGTINPRCSTPVVEQLLRSTTVGYLRPSDRAILRRLSSSGLNPERSDVPGLLRDVLATGRARLGVFPGIEARLGPAREGRLGWHLEADASQRTVLSVAGGGLPVLSLAPWYLDEQSGEVGQVDIAIPPVLLHRLLNAPPVPASQVEAVRAGLVAALPGIDVPAPLAVPHGGVIDGAPVPLLRLERLSLPLPAVVARLGGAAAALSFQYGPIVVGETVPAGAQEQLHDGKRYTLVRDAKAEKAAGRALEEWGFTPLRRAAGHLTPPPLRDRRVLEGGDADGQWLDFMLDGVPALRAMGWAVETTPDFPHDLIAPTGPMDATLQEGSGIDWFDLNLGVMVGEERIDLVPPILKILAGPDATTILEMLRDPEEDDSQKMVLSLKDGRRLALDVSVLRPILVTLFDLFGAGGLAAGSDGFRISRQGAADVAALEQAGLSADLVWRGGDALRALGRMLRSRGGIGSAPVPAWFTASLRPYQQQGVDWLQFLREAGLGGVLADDMGLGKTVQTLAHLCVEKQAGRLTHPALVICPTSVVGNWAKEAARFAPDLRVLPLQGTERKARFGDIAHSDLVISTYPLLARDGDVLSAQDWHVLILDEAQTVKNPAATMAQTVRRLRADQRICLTGTPMENHLGELWALFDFMMPGFLGSAQDFGKRFRNPIEKGGDKDRHAALAKRVSPFLLRRTKANVLKDLPPRTDIIETIQLEKPQRAVYDGVRLAMHAKVQAAIAEKGMAKSGIVILDALLKLRQTCCDPRLLKIGGTAAKKAGSAKLERLLELLDTLREEGRSILLFSQFTSMLALIEEELVARRVKYVKLTGETVDRATPVDTFQAGKVKLFLISLKAGGVGLNLTAADTVIHYDPWWNPAVENQATDRAHRIGQTKKVFVHRLITEDTIEEKMEGLKARKSALAEGILGGAGADALKMTEADVQMLFS
jgi:superfamily II DNA or RNA helicase